MTSRPAIWLRTARLSLRRFERDDLPFLCRLYGSERIARHIGGVKTETACCEMLEERILAYYASNPGLGIWLTSEIDTARPVGLHLLNHIRGETHIQVGYVLDTAFWGRGYATEMTRALVDYGFHERGLAQITAITDLANTASQRVLEKCGLRRCGERVLAHPVFRGELLAWFECDAQTWTPHPQRRAHWMRGGLA